MPREKDAVGDSRLAQIAGGAADLQRSGTEFVISVRPARLDGGGAKMASGALRPA